MSAPRRAACLSGNSASSDLEHAVERAAMTVGALLAGILPRRARDQQHDLPARDIGIRPGARRKLGEGAPIGRFMQLGDFARQHRAALAAECGGTILEHVRERDAAIRTAPACAARRRATPAACVAPRRARGKNPSKQKRSVGSAPIDSAAMAAQGPGIATTSTPAAAAARTSSKPGSLMAGVPASLTNAMLSPWRSRARKSRYSLLLVVIMQGKLRRLDAEVLEKHPGVARVLRRDQCAGPQGLAGTRAQVAQIADRGRHHVEPPGCSICHL